MAGTPAHGSRVCDTFQSTGGNDMPRAGNVLSATCFATPRDQHLTGKLRLGEVGADLIS